MNEHPSREQLAAFLGGQLSGSELASLSRHIETCDACCQMLRDVPDDAFVARLRDATPPPTGHDEELAPVPTARGANPPEELRDHPRYKIGRCLGAGGMGAVFLAEHRLMDRLVALKVIHRDLLRNPRVLDRFRQEIRSFRPLNHPNIVQAFDADCVQARDDPAQSIHFLVTEFIDGMSLDKLIAKRGALALEIVYACNFVRQAAKGLQHAFEAGMVHRDIKPHNLMLTRRGQIKILDFGLARVGIEARVATGPARAGNDAPGLTKFGDLMGTPEYMAPEQISDPSKADIRADLYSLGCTLFFLLTGQPPFKAESSLQLLFLQQHKLPPSVTELRPEVTPELAGIVAKLLAKSAPDRYATPAELIKVLTPFTKPTPLAAPTPLPPTKAITVAPEPVVERVEPALVAPPKPDPRVFQARCPFCSASIRIPHKALGRSIPCPHCSSYFTAVPMDG